MIYLTRFKYDYSTRFSGNEGEREKYYNYVKKMFNLWHISVYRRYY